MSRDESLTVADVVAARTMFVMPNGYLIDDGAFARVGDVSFSGSATKGTCATRADATNGPSRYSVREFVGCVDHDRAVFWRATAIP